MYFIQTLTLITGFLYLFGLLSLFIKERLFLSETLVSTLYGILIAPFLNKSIIDSSMHDLSRIILSLQVVAVGVCVPKKFVQREWKILFIILVPLMLLTFLTSSLIVYFSLHLETNTSFLISLVIGACITPTDPVLAAAILKGKFSNRYIPKHLKNLLIVESGANDGLGFLLLTIPLLFIKKQKVSDWLLQTILREIILSVVLGALIGYLARKVLSFSRAKNLIDKESFLVSILTLGLFVTGSTALLKSDDILACFVCGMFFAWDENYKQEIHESHLIEVFDLLFNHAFFIFFGAMVRYTWKSFKPCYFLAVVGVLILRRLPFFFMLRPLMRNTLKSGREVFFAGWFGPMGVGALFFAYHAGEQIEEHKDLIMTVVCAVVVGSVFVHGLTAPIVNFHLKRKVREVEDYEESTVSCL